MPEPYAPASPRVLLLELHALSVVLTPSPDGTLRTQAPTGVLTPALREGIRQHTDALHGLVEVWEERAAILEYDGGLKREEAETLAWQFLREEHGTHG